MKSRKIINSLWRIAALFLFLYVIFGYQYKLTYNKGESMEPTHSDGDWVIVQKRNNLPKNWTPSRYDAVIIEEDGHNEDLCKRVVGVPGDKLEIKEGIIFVNNKRLKDSFGRGKMSYYLTDENDKDLYYWGTQDQVVKYINQKQITIPKGHVWVIGDNREISWFGMLPIKNIKGLILL
jgi:signal peptidase I